MIFSCPICKNSILSKQIPRKTYGFVIECVICGHYSLWPQPSSREVIAQYQKEYYKSRGIAKGTIKGRALFDNIEVELLKKHDLRKDLSVIDVGCGQGTLLRYCVKNGYRAIGMDISEEAVNSLQKEGFEVYNKSIEEMEQSKQQYDWVICKDVLEHVMDPLKTIDILMKMVKDDGMLLISSPNGNTISTYGECTYMLHVDEEHLNYFRPEQLIRLIESKGFCLKHKTFYPRSSGTGKSGTLKKTNSYRSSARKDNTQQLYCSNKKNGRI